MRHLEIELDHVHVDLGLTRVLHDLTLCISGQTHYAVLGDNGAGKTTLLRLLTGEIWPSQRGGGQRVYRLNGEETLSPIAARPFMRMVTPDQADWYRRHDLNVPVWEVICGGLAGMPLLYTPPTEEMRECSRLLGRDMGLGGVLDRPMRSVSTGQAKRALLARAFISDPKLLAVDELTQGLDRAGQHALLDTLEKMAATGRTRLLVSGHGLLPVPACVTRRIHLERGRIADSPPCGSSPPPLSLPARQRHDTSSPRHIFHMRACSVVMDAHPAVNNLTWTVEAGQRWAVLGRNGSGKSTLLQLATGYRHPWPGGKISWFGHQGRPEISSVRGRMGILAPWLAERLEPGVSCRDVILSGLCDGLGVHRNLSPADEAGADELIRLWGMEDWAERQAGTLSYGQFRQVMLARAVARGPELLVLDEPFSGLDAPWRERVAMLLRNWTGQSRTLILATHSPEYMEDLPTHGLLLDDGTCVFQGSWKKLSAHPAFGELFGRAD